jgi:hypothetical protein
VKFGEAGVITAGGAAKELVIVKRSEGRHMW